MEKEVEEPFVDLKEKPQNQGIGSLIGRKFAGSTTVRPIKVVLENSPAVHQILLKAKLLEQIEARKTMPMNPDRSADIGEYRRNPVTELKKLIKEPLNRRHHIRAHRI